MFRSPVHRAVVSVRSLALLRVRPITTSVTDEEQVIDSARARELLDNSQAKFIDVRTPEKYSETHIYGAVNIHTFFTYLATSDASGVRELTDTFTEELQNAGISGAQGEHVVTYEDSMKTLYGASCRAFYILKLLGHPKVSVLSGGFENWLENGYPTTRDVPQVSRGTFQPKWTPSMWSGKEEVVEAVKNEDAVILDVRDYEEWCGASSSPYGVDFAPRKGRIPGATYVAWTDFMDLGRGGLVSFKKPEEIRELCAAKGVIRDQKIIVYCFKGARASNTYLALKRAGFDSVTNYFASWNEWSRDDELSIDSKFLS